MPFVYVVALVGALGGMLFGYDTGAISGAILYLKREFSLSSGLQEVVTSIALAGAVVGAAVGGPLADRYGRRRLIVVTAAMFVLGSFAAAATELVGWLIASRVFIGGAIGIASFVTPLYLSEIAPAAIRGALVSLNQVAVTIGILASYLVDYAFAYPGGWRWMFGIGALPAFALGAGILLMPSSPRWLMTQGRRSEARTGRPAATRARCRQNPRRRDRADKPRRTEVRRAFRSMQYDRIRLPMMRNSQSWCATMCPTRGGSIATTCPRTRRARRSISRCAT